MEPVPPITQISEEPKVRARRRLLFITMLARAAVKAKRQNHSE